MAVTIAVNLAGSMQRRGLRVNVEWMLLDDCPVGYTAVPYPVGGNGSVYHAAFELNF